MSQLGTSYQSEFRMFYLFTMAIYICYYLPTIASRQQMLPVDKYIYVDVRNDVPVYNGRNKAILLYY